MARPSHNRMRAMMGPLSPASQPAAIRSTSADRSSTLHSNGKDMMFLLLVRAYLIMVNTKPIELLHPFIIMMRYTADMILSLLVGFVLGAAALLFALQNT